MWSRSALFTECKRSTASSLHPIQVFVEVQKGKKKDSVLSEEEKTVETIWMCTFFPLIASNSYFYFYVPLIRMILLKMLLIRNSWLDLLQQFESLAVPYDRQSFIRYIQRLVYWMSLCHIFIWNWIETCRSLNNWINHMDVSDVLNRLFHKFDVHDTWQIK